MYLFTITIFSLGTLGDFSLGVAFWVFVVICRVESFLGG